MERSGLRRFWTFSVAPMLSNLKSLRAAILLAALVIIINLVLNGVVINHPVEAQLQPQVGGGGRGTVTINVPQIGTSVCSPEQGTGAIRFDASLNPDGTVIVDPARAGNFGLGSNIASISGTITGGAVAYPGVVGSSFSLTAAYSDCGQTKTATITGTCGTDQQITLESTGQLAFSGTGDVTCLLPPTQTTIISATDGNGNSVGNGGSTSSTAIRFEVTATEGTNPIVGFRCSVDGSIFGNCPTSPTTNPATFTYVLGIFAPGKQHTFAVFAVDTQGVGDPNPATFSWNVTLINHPPNAVARSDFPPHIVDNEVTLSGSESNDPDPGDSITEYHWEQVDNSGVKVTLSDPDSATTSFNAPSRVPTRYISEDSSPQIIPLQFSLVVTDTHGATSQPAIVSVTIQCDPGTEVNCDVVNTKLDVIKNGLAALGLTESAKRLDHWRAGSGIDLPLDVGWLRNTNTIQAAEKANQLRFEINNEGSGESIIREVLYLANGQSTTFSDKWDKGISITDEVLSRDIDLATAVGTTQLTSKGTFQIERHGQIYSITGTVVHSVTDRYKFNPGEQFPPVTPMTTADELNLLEKCRGANQFNQDATWTQTLQARGTLNSLLNTAGNPHAKIWVWTGP